MASSTAEPPAGWDAARIDAEAPGNPLEQLADVVLSRILSRVGTRTVFGEPVTQGEMTVVPVAKVSTRFGFGGGSGNNPAKDDGQDGSSGSGMGGGGDVKAKPLGYIEITSRDSRFVPIEDSMEIGMVAMKFIGVAIVLIALRFLLRRGSKRGAVDAELLEAQPENGKRRLRIVRAVPWGTVASVVAAASKARARRAA
jgi:uncharacterized spore protein YtfJ